MTNEVSDNLMSQVKGIEVQFTDSVVTLVNLEGHYLYLSNQSLEHGYGPTDKMGRPFEDFIHPSDIPLVYKAMQDALIADRSEPIRVRIRTRKGYEYVDRFSKRLIDENTRRSYLVNVATRLYASFVPIQPHADSASAVDIESLDGQVA